LVARFALMPEALHSSDVVIFTIHHVIMDIHADLPASRFSSIGYYNCVGEN
jgi:hypothetical protein